MTDKVREFVEQIARMVIPGDDDEAMQKRVEEAREEGGYDENEPDDSMDDEDYVLAAADDEFLCSETGALWETIREARKLLKASVEGAQDAPAE